MMVASRFQFPTSLLFYCITLNAVATALFGWLGLPIACFLLLIWCQLIFGLQRESNSNLSSSFQPRTINQSAQGQSWFDHKYEFFVAGLSLTLLVGLLNPVPNDADSMQHAETSMKLVAKALRAYETDHGCFPPSIVRDSAGRPLHSWRVLILKYLGENKLAHAYDFDAPWDSPQNQALASFRPRVFQPYYPDRSASQESTPLQLTKLATGEVGLIEHEPSECHWMQPTSYQQCDELENPPSLKFGFWARGFFVSQYRGRLRQEGDNIVRLEPPVFASRRIHYANIVKLLAFLITALLPLRWLQNVGPDGLN